LWRVGAIRGGGRRCPAVGASSGTQRGDGTYAVARASSTGRRGRGPGAEGVEEQGGDQDLTQADVEICRSAGVKPQGSVSEETLDGQTGMLKKSKKKKKR